MNIISVALPWNPDNKEGACPPQKEKWAVSHIHDFKPHSIIRSDHATYRFVGEANVQHISFFR
jgi:hypothetical protein